MLDICEPYILNETNMNNYLKYKITTPIKTASISKENENEKEKNSYKYYGQNEPIYFPKEQDSLYWCFYIMKNGMEQYEMLQNRNIIITKQHKIDNVIKLREKEHKPFLKHYKLDSIVNIENNLVNDDCINIKTFFSLCLIHKLNVIFVYKKTYFELMQSFSKGVFIVREKSFNNNNNNNNNNSKYVKKYGFEKATDIVLSDIRDNYYGIENLSKPLKSESFYKVDDLRQIAIKLNIDTLNHEKQKQKTKNELYESIMQYLI